MSTLTRRLARASTTRARCVFCQIVGGETPGYIVYEDAVALGFLDRRPLFHGHCLLVPKTHYETLDDLPGAVIAPLFGAVQLLTRAVERGMDADGSFVAINMRISQGLPHLHVHVVPRWARDGLFARTLVWKRHPYPDEESIASVQRALAAAVAQLQFRAHEQAARRRLHRTP